MSFSNILIFKPKFYCHLFYCRKLESDLTLLSNKFACFSSGINTQCTSLCDVCLCRRVGHLFSVIATANCSSSNSWVWNVKVFWDRTRWAPFAPSSLIHCVCVYTRPSARSTRFVSSGCLWVSDTWFRPCVFCSLLHSCLLFFPSRNLPCVTGQKQWCPWVGLSSSLPLLPYSEFESQDCFVSYKPWQMTKAFCFQSCLS